MKTKISCLLLSTAKRLEWLKKSINSINLLDFDFEEKILSIDEFDGHKIDKNDLEIFKSQGWIIDLVSFKNKHKSLKNSIELCSGDYIFYTEDDIEIIKFPKKINEILENQINNKKCGLLSMNLGGSKLDYPSNMGDLPLWKENIFFIQEEFISFLRLESEASKWFVEFPCVFFNTDLLKKLLNVDFINNTNIEETLTNIFFTENFNELYFKASICHKEVLNIIDLLCSQKDVSFWNEKLESVKLYKLIDSNQGGANINLNEIKYVQ